MTEVKLNSQNYDRIDIRPLCISWLKKLFAFKSEFIKQNFGKTTLYKSFKSGFAFFLQKTFGSKSNYLQK